MALKKYCRSKMVRPKEEDTDYIYDEKTDDPILYDDLSSHICDCAEQWFKFQTNDPVTIIDRKYDKELKK
jgi:hypothetical protein